MSQHVNLTVQTRETIGNKVRVLRRNKIIPAVIYGKQQEPVHIQVGFSEFYNTFKQAGTTHVVDLVLEDGTKFSTIIHDYDVHPVTGKLRHVDFLAVNLKEEVVASVPVVYLNESPAVKEFGAVVLTNFEEIEVKALPDSIPDKIEVDLSLLKTMSDIIRVSDLSISPSYTYVQDADDVVAALTNQSQEVEEPVAVETTETTDTASQTVGK